MNRSEASDFCEDEESAEEVWSRFEELESRPVHGIHLTAGLTPTLNDVTVSAPTSRGNQIGGNVALHAV